MNPFDELIARKTPDQLREWTEPVKRNGRDLNARPLRAPVANVERLHFPGVPPMDTRCTCGLRYGQHRVNDYRCPNQEWKPGNGQPQWKTAVFRRAG